MFWRTNAAATCSHPNGVCRQNCERLIRRKQIRCQLCSEIKTKAKGSSDLLKRKFKGVEAKLRSSLCPNFLSIKTFVPLRSNSSCSDAPLVT